MVRDTSGVPAHAIRQIVAGHATLLVAQDLQRSVAGAGLLAVRTRTEAHVVAEAPVVDVVPRDAVAATPRGYLVTLQAGMREPVAAAALDLLQKVFVWQRRRRAVKRGIRLDRQLIPGQMLDAAGQRDLQVLERAGHGLAW